MRAAPYAFLVGAVGAGIVHIAIILALPSVSAAERWKRLEEALPAGRMTAGGSPFFVPDPFFRVAACRFDLGNGPARLRAGGPVSAWFLSVQAPDGNSLGSLNDRETDAGAFDVLVLTPAQRAAAATRLGGAAPVEVEAGQAMAVLEVFVPDRSWSAATDAFLASVSCTPAPGR